MEFYGDCVLVQNQDSPTLHAGHGVRLHEGRKKWVRLSIRATGSERTILTSGIGFITPRMERRLVVAVRAT